MKKDFKLELKKIKNLYKQNMSLEERKNKLGGILSSLSKYINLGKVDLVVDSSFVLYGVEHSNDSIDLELDYGYAKYYPVKDHSFTEDEIELIELLNEYINILFSGVLSVKTEDDLELFSRSHELSDYSVLCMNLNNYNYLRSYFGEKVDSLFDDYYDSLSKLLEEDEKISNSSKNNFVVLLKKENVKQFLKFKELIELPLTKENTECFNFDIRTGVYNIEQGITINEAIEKALMALYMAEHVYKTTSLVFTEEMEQIIVKEQRILSIFPQALKDHEFSVYYQPKVDLTENSMYGSEALVRWCKGNEVISPGEFIPILERENILYQLDFYVLEQVCKDMRKWLDEGVTPVKTSINFSKKSIKNCDFLSRLLEILKQYRIESEYIEIELTETVETVDFQQLINFVDSMRQNRINVSIDDFGTGYSSLNLIKILSATTIKVDKSFIDHIDEKKDSVVVKSIIDIASELGFEVIAEGAETVQQVDILRSMGCNKIQGYYFDKPLPKDEFEKRLTDSNCYSSQFQIVKTKNESL